MQRRQVPAWVQSGRLLSVVARSKYEGRKMVGHEYERRRRSGGFVTGFLLGGLVGAGIALLTAPQSGERMREQIRSKSMELRDQAERRVDRFTTITDEYRRQGATAFDEAQQRLSDAMEETRQIAMQTIDDMRNIIVDAVEEAKHSVAAATHETEETIHKAREETKQAVEQSTTGV